jgi:hypothetical protein
MGADIDGMCRCGACSYVTVHLERRTPPLGVPVVKSRSGRRYNTRDDDPVCDLGLRRCKLCGLLEPHECLNAGSLTQPEGNWDYAQRPRTR